MRSRNDLPRAGPGPSLAWALAALTILLLWQFLTVHYNRGGNWTALFLTGTQYPVPQQLDAGTYRFPGAGYDGQMYRYVAHAPFSPKIYERYIDKAEDRYRRILIPALAYLLAGGQDAWIDGAYIALVALFVFLGAYWLSRWAVLEGAHPAWALAFLLAPATLISMDRMTVDVALAAFTAGFVLYSSSAEWTKFYFILMLACLARETGLLLVAGACAFELFRRRFPRALLWASAGVPALAWYAWLRHAYPARPRLGCLNGSPTASARDCFIGCSIRSNTRCRRRSRPSRGSRIPWRWWAFCWPACSPSSFSGARIRSRRWCSPAWPVRSW